VSTATLAEATASAAAVAAMFLEHLTCCPMFLEFWHLECSCGKFGFWVARAGSYPDAELSNIGATAPDCRMLLQLQF